MAKLPKGITQAELDEYLRLDLGMKKLKTRHDILNEKIKTAFKGIGTFVFGNVIVKRTDSNKFDKKAAELDFPVATHKQYYTLTFDPSLLPADVRAKYTTKTKNLSVEKASVVE